jgi:hypothetical protein
MKQEMQKMRVLLSSVALAAALATSAFAQSEDETYQEIYERGGLGDISNMESSLGRLLRVHNVPETCLAKLTVADASSMNLILNDSSYSDQEKRSQIRTMLQEKCQ